MIKTSIPIHKCETSQINMINGKIADQKIRFRSFRKVASKKKLSCFFDSFGNARDKK